MRPRTGLLLLFLGLVLVLSAQQDKQGQENDSGTLTVKGILHLRDGSLASGVEVFVFPYREGNALYDLGIKKDGKIALSNPSATSDRQGRFTIRFLRNYIVQKETTEFVVGTFPYGRVNAGARPLKDVENAMAVAILELKLFDQAKTTTLDLSKVAKKLIVDE